MCSLHPLLAKNIKGGILKNVQKTSASLLMTLYMINDNENETENEKNIIKMRQK